MVPPTFENLRMPLILKVWSVPGEMLSISRTSEALSHFFSWVLVLELRSSLISSMNWVLKEWRSSIVMIVADISFIGFCEGQKKKEKECKRGTGGTCTPVYPLSYRGFGVLKKIIR